MANLTNIGFLARLRSDASHHVIRYRGGKVRQSGRGLVFWFRPDVSSIVELPIDDRETTIFVRGRSADFQAVNVQGVVGWRVVEPERLADRIDFTISLSSGLHNGQPIEKIEARLTGIVNQAALDYLAAADVRPLLDAGIEPLRKALDAALAASPVLEELGIAVVSVGLQNLAPSSELERALQTPANARDRAQGVADASHVEAEAEANRIRTVEGAKAEAELGHMAVYRDLPPQVLLGLAAREFAGKLDTIEHLNVTPDLLANLLRELGGRGAALVEAR